MVVKSVGLDEEMVKQVQISNNEKQQLCHIVELSSPVVICEQFHCHFVCYDLLEQELEKKAAVTGTAPPLDAFAILMSSQRVRSLPSKGEVEHNS